MQIDGHRLLRVALATALMCLPVSGQDQVVPMNGTATKPEAAVLQVAQPTDLRSILGGYFDIRTAQSITALVLPTLGSSVLPEWSQITAVMGPGAEPGALFPYRLTILTPRKEDGLLVPRATVAINDKGVFVLATTEPRWPEPGEDVEGRTSRHAAN